MAKKNILAIGICAICFVALMTVAAFFDLQIDEAIGNADSVFGQFFANLGEIPAWLAIPVAGIILYQAVRKDNKYAVWLKIAFLALTFVGTLFLFRYFSKHLFTELKWKYLYLVVFSVAVEWLAVLGTNKVDKELMEKLVFFAVFLIIVLAVSQGITTLFKWIWSRQRFRNLEAGNITGGEARGFTPWYKPNWGNPNKNYYYPDSAGADADDAYKSFPSGHTAAAAMTFVLIMLPDMFEKLRKYKMWFYIGPAIYTLLVAVSRMVNRAHYLSDVTMGATITIVTVFVVRWLMYLIRNKLDAKKLIMVEEPALVEEDKDEVGQTADEN